jgi:hypothetical protein
VEVDQVTGIAEFKCQLHATGLAESLTKPLTMFCNDYMDAAPVEVGHWTKVTDGIGPTNVFFPTPPVNFVGPYYSNGVASHPFVSNVLGNLSMTFTGQPVGSYVWVPDINSWASQFPLTGPYQMNHTSTIQTQMDLGLIAENVLDTGIGASSTSDIPTGDAITHTVDENIEYTFNESLDQYLLSNEPFTQLAGIVMCPCLPGAAHATLTNQVDLLTPWD